MDSEDCIYGVDLTVTDERDALQVIRSKGIDISTISRILCRHVSSVYRELERNSGSFNIYLAEKAHKKAVKRRKLHSPKPVTDNKHLMMCVERLLRKEYSPVLYEKMLFPENMFIMPM
jgi:IS30 family transposase